MYQQIIVESQNLHVLNDRLVLPPIMVRVLVFLLTHLYSSLEHVQEYFAHVFEPNFVRKERERACVRNQSIKKI